jgi:dihydrolipoamide dehydrogenase
MDRLFPGEDREVHDLFDKLYGKIGIEAVTGDMVESLEGGGEEDCRVGLASGRVLEAHSVLIGAGRRLLTEGLGLETVGLETGAGGEIVVDGELRTAREGIFAVGDVTGKLLLAHLASFQGLQAGLRAIGRKGREVPYHAVPWTIFTSPEIATVGLNETAARSDGLSCLAASIPWMDNVKARIDKTTDGFVKIVADRKTGQIVGGTVVGPHASDMIHIIGTAVHHHHTVDDMAAMVFAHPGLAETIHEVLEKLLHRLIASEGDSPAPEAF